MVPNSPDRSAAIATITFVNGWNAGPWPPVVGQDPGARTVRVAFSSYVTNQTVHHDPICMATAPSVLPPGARVPLPPAPAVRGIARTGVKG
ncbi:hypothetical protein GCM10020295_17090 [Streptomyces cinereospinus]